MEPSHSVLGSVLDRIGDAASRRPLSPQEERARKEAPVKLTEWRRASN